MNPEMTAMMKLADKNSEGCITDKLHVLTDRGWQVKQEVQKGPKWALQTGKNNMWNETSISRVSGLDTAEVTPQSTMICCALSLQHSFTPGPMRNCGFNAPPPSWLSSWQPTVWQLKICVCSIPQEGLMETVCPEFSFIDKFVSFLPKKSILL